MGFFPPLRSVKEDSGVLVTSDAARRVTHRDRRAKEVLADTLPQTQGHTRRYRYTNTGCGRASGWTSCGYQRSKPLIHSEFLGILLPCAGASLLAWSLWPSQCPLASLSSLTLPAALIRSSPRDSASWRLPRVAQVALVLLEAAAEGHCGAVRARKGHCILLHPAGRSRVGRRKRTRLKRLEVSVASCMIPL